MFRLTLVQGAYYSIFTVGCAGIVYSCYNLVRVCFARPSSVPWVNRNPLGQIRDRVDISVASIELNLSPSPA